LGRGASVGQFAYDDAIGNCLEKIKNID